MKYDSATIDVTLPSGIVETIDFEDMRTTGDLVEKIRELATDPDEEGEPMDDDELLEAVTLHNPQGFAVHLFDKSSNGHALWNVSANFDDIAEAWSNETDSDRREAMGEYLDDMGADDLSDFDEAYQGQFDSGAAFAESIAEEVGDIPKNLPSWICIDWERSWESALRFDYTITDSGHVFRNL